MSLGRNPETLPLDLLYVMAHFARDVLKYPGLVSLVETPLFAGFRGGVLKVRQ